MRQKKSRYKKASPRYSPCAYIFEKLILRFFKFDANMRSRANFFYSNLISFRLVDSDPSNLKKNTLLSQDKRGRKRTNMNEMLSAYRYILCSRLE